MLLHPIFIAPMSPRPGGLQGAPPALQDGARCCPCFGKASEHAGHWHRAAPSSGSQGQQCGVLSYSWVLGVSVWEWSRLCMMAPPFSTDEAWTEVIDTLAGAAIRFEMLSTAHRSQVGQQLAQSQGWQAVGTAGGSVLSSPDCDLSLPSDHPGPGEQQHLHEGNEKWCLRDVQLCPAGHALQQLPAGCGAG